MKTDNCFETSRITFIVAGWIFAIVLSSAGTTRAGTWTQKTDMPTARMGFSTSVVDGKIYAVSALQGGVNRLTKVEVYDPATDTWTEKADMPTTRTFVATSVVDGKIYAIGGTNSWGGTYLATVEMYNPMRDTWTRKADMPTARITETSVVNGIIYAIGGSRNGAAISTVEAYDPVTDTWTRKADMPTARTLHSTQTVGGKIYAMGGQTFSTFAAFSTVEVYDPVTDTWTRKGNLPVPRTSLPTSVVGDKIFGFGGRATRGGAPLSSVFEYDTVTDTWTAKDDMPVRNGGMGVSTVGGRIYVIGGSSALYPFNSVLSTVWEYDTGLGVSSPDFNGDGIVDSRDVSIMVDHWHTDNALCDIAPLPFGDNFIDVQDLISLSEYLLEELDDPTLAAHWALDETEGDIAQDSAGDNLGYVFGGPVWQPAGGQVNGAIQLDGVDDAVIVGLPVNPAVGPFSVFAWIQGGAPGQVIISESAGSDWLSLDPLAGHLMTELTKSGRGAAPLLSQAVVTDGNWHRIGFVWDGLHRTLYVDGVAVAEDMQDSLANAANGLYIGAGKAMAPGTYFSGLIDDIRVYNRAIAP